MKKNQLITVLSVLGISFALGLSTTSVHADSTGTTSADSTGTTSKGEFAVSAGSLSIDSVPDFNFGSTSVKDLTTGTTLNYQSGSNNKLTVSDYRGVSNPEWTLEANLSNFTNDKGSNVAGSINLATDKKATGTISKNDSTVWDYGDAETKGAGNASATVSTDTKLVTEPNRTVDAGPYTSTITWTMTNTAASAK